MNSKHRKTLEAVFADPVRENIPREDVEALLVAMGAERYDGNGPRVRLLFNGARATFHPPHPQKETDRGAVGSVWWRAPFLLVVLVRLPHLLALYDAFRIAIAVLGRGLVVVHEADALHSHALVVEERVAASVHQVRMR